MPSTSSKTPLRSYVLVLEADSFENDHPIIPPEPQVPNLSPALKGVDRGSIDVEEISGIDSRTVDLGFGMMASGPDEDGFIMIENEETVRLDCSLADMATRLGALSVREHEDLPPLTILGGRIEESKRRKRPRKEKSSCTSDSTAINPQPTQIHTTAIPILPRRQDQHQRLEADSRPRSYAKVARSSMGRVSSGVIGASRSAPDGGGRTERKSVAEQLCMDCDQDPDEMTLVGFDLTGALGYGWEVDTNTIKSMEPYDVAVQRWQEQEAESVWRGI